MIRLLMLLAVGVLSSAFFSGSETGFYRVSRMRLVLDAVGGHAISRWLLWLINNPSLFVATTLVGNNLANYITSLAIVGITQQVIHGETHLEELVIPILVSPIIFVYCELLPKNLYFNAPNRMLRRGGPLFLCFTVLFAPIAAILWALGRLLQWGVGQAPEQVQAALARNELKQVFHAGQQAGILQPAQQALAQQLFAVAVQPIAKFCTPLSRFNFGSLGDPKTDALKLAKRTRASIIAICGTDPHQLVGYVRVVDLYLNKTTTIDAPRSLLEIPETATHSAALLQMQSEKAPVARVVDGDGQTVGLVLAEDLREPLFRTP